MQTSSIGVCSKHVETKSLVQNENKKMGVPPNGRPVHVPTVQLLHHMQHAPSRLFIAPGATATPASRRSAAAAFLSHVLSLTPR